MRKLHGKMLEYRIKSRLRTALLLYNKGTFRVPRDRPYLRVHAIDSPAPSPNKTANLTKNNNSRCRGLKCLILDPHSLSMDKVTSFIHSFFSKKKGGI